jgi:glycosyltransferase involved in cell wall biosynthesis
MLVSVIIAAYNHAHFLGDAIRSVLQQTYPHFEIIVVDDGSTDNTRGVVSEFGDRVRYVWQENKGLSAARNTGIRTAAGKLIGLLDADDLYEPEFFSTLVAILNSNTGLDGVFCTARTVDINNNLLPQHIGQAVRPEEFRYKLLNGGFFPPLCMIVNKYCYENMDQLFDESLTALEDWDMWLRFSERYKILGIDEPLVRYRIVPGSMSRDPERMSRNRSVVIQKHFFDEPTDRLKWSSIHRKAMGYSHVRATIESLQADDQNRANRYMHEAFNIYPELAADMDVFYRLGLGGQPMGYRGVTTMLDLEENANLLLAMMDELFTDSETGPRLASHRRTAYANAYLALGLLHYNSRRFDEARQFLVCAVKADPRFALRQKCVETLTKTLLGPRVVDRLKAIKSQALKGVPLSSL